MIGRTIIELDRVDSTNNYASQLFSTGEFEDGTVVLAHEQFSGRGQHKHSWSSEAGKNLTLTVCLRPRFLAPGRQFHLNKAIALGVLDFIRSFPEIVSDQHYRASAIKWPNDLYVGNRKIAGILIENRIMGSFLETSFVGIGININQTIFASDIPNPVSLIHILGHETDLKAVLISLCGFLEIRYRQLWEVNNDTTDQDFDQNLLGFKEWREFATGGTRIRGKIDAVDETGRLLVEFPTGEIKGFSHKEIEYLI
jgi:BirA family transcriptional regulator, biotin operon repressor / biotin---[acetyl-CoA-carboxylase] ligase